MASDEVSRAYSEYMGTSPLSQASNQHPYFYPKFQICPWSSSRALVRALHDAAPPAFSLTPFEVAPAAPTPPPAAPSIPSSYYPVGYYQPAPASPQYVEPYSGHADGPAIQPYSSTWHQHPDHLSPLLMTTVASNRATAGSSHPSRSGGDDAQQARAREQWHFYELEHLGPPAPFQPPAKPAEPQPQAVVEVPFTQCHTCAVCGRLRSPNFHRRHPVVPRQPLKEGICRSCHKKAQKELEEQQAKEQQAKEQEERDRYDRTFTYVRKCTADEPCEWPDEEVHIRMGRDEPRGRARSRSFDRDDVYVVRHRSHSRPRVVKRSESRSCLGMRAFQKQERSPPRTARRNTSVRVSSVSPHRGVRIETSMHWDDARPPPPLPANDPAPKEEPLPRPPMYYREAYYSNDAGDRMAAHPMPYRIVKDYMPTPKLPPEPPSMPLPRHRVHFTQERPPKALPEISNREQYQAKLRRYEDESQYIENYRSDYHRQRPGGNPYARDPSPPTRDFGRVRIRDYSPVPRGRSPVPSSKPRHAPPSPEDFGKRSPSPEDRVFIEYRSSCRPSQPPPDKRGADERKKPPSPSPPPRVRYRVIPQPVLPEREAPPPKPEKKEKDFDSVTASDSEDDISYRVYKEYDEYGKAWKVWEERRTHQVSDGKVTK
ncbi:hypothetical protein K491DRAFT_772834 [Lophiostoma macrostomum CBS 122681]|uniref:Uncharacterized protein n=1 Tax=Lophiostoma macrostomum CBS 122681 TaxID=1314788 RepID=A0A6A6TSB7_9PLEO|nr:hypothetical protein K491DRAFT_772834 [Lophiostoma macrostomum CBS 122681]